ncbi:MAG: hypothetical protein KBH11_02605 [Bacteroidia bacterium]|nr:hypothetical protein [Bacteroidota bacterium]MBP9081935.1 hypothetical protein [Bacteroidia bacterium]
MDGKCLMLFLTFWLLFGQAKSNKACMADAKQNEKEDQIENGEWWQLENAETTSI